MTAETPTEDLIRYDVMVQDALLGVVRKVLQDAARLGLPGEHHFYITFRSQAPGVKLSTRLREKYPDEMTVVLQHQFWDLIVGETGFEVGLSFGGVPERLVVPYEAMTGFYDPSVQFGLKFTPDEALADNDAGEEEPSVREQLDAITTLEKAARPRKGKTDGKADGKTESRAEAKDAGDTATEPAKRPRGKAGEKAGAEKAGAEKAETGAAESPAEAEAAKPAGVEVVSLEAFRKKK